MADFDFSKIGETIKDAVVEPFKFERGSSELDQIEFMARARDAVLAVAVVNTGSADAHEEMLAKIDAEIATQQEATVGAIATQSEAPVKALAPVHDIGTGQSITEKVQPSIINREGMIDVEEARRRVQAA